MFDKMKQLMQMREKMQEVKRQLDSTNFEVTNSDGSIRITMNGSQETQQISIQGNIQGIEKSHLESSLRDIFNRAIKRSHEIAAQKTKDIVGINLPGIL